MVASKTTQLYNIHNWHAYKIEHSSKGWSSKTFISSIQHLGTLVTLVNSHQTELDAGKKWLGEPIQKALMNKSTNKD